MHVYHVFPYPWYVSGGHSNGIRAFIESQASLGLQVQAISPGPDPAQINAPIPQLDISVNYSSVLRAFDESQVSSGNQALAIRSKSDSLQLKTSSSIPQLSCPVKYLDYERVDWQQEVSDIVSEAQGKVVFHLYQIGGYTHTLSQALKKFSVQYVYNSQGELSYRSFVNFVKKFSYFNFVNPYIRNASVLHLLTQREKDRLKYLIPYWKGHILVLPNIVSLPSEDSIHPPMLRSQHGIPDSVFLFLYFGRLDIQQKGLDILLKAFAKLPKQCDCHLAFVGPDFKNGKKQLVQLAESLDCANKVHIVEPQYGLDKWRILKMADAFVSPSRWEGFGIAIAEAIGVGVPTITSNRANIAPDLEQHKAAIISKLEADELSKHMLEFVQNHKLRNEISERGRQWVSEAYSPAKAGALFEDFYATL